MNLNYLDNPGWHALNSHHHILAILEENAARYQPGVFFAGAMSDNSPAGFSDLRNLLDVNETIGVVGPLPEVLPGWQVSHQGKVAQMICEDLKPAPPKEVVNLTEVAVPEMLELVALSQPGPFLPRTIEMGQYFGVRQDDRLVAMAGERLHLTGFCEISAVCTHSDFRGRGYASALTTMVAETIFARQELPFLHLSPTNDVARKLYKKLGFRLRKEIQLTMLQRLNT